MMFNQKSAYPLGNEPIYHNGAIIGKTTSAAFGYRVDKPIALASLKTQGVDFNNVVVQVDIAGQHFDATVSSHPIFDPTGKRMKG